MSTSIDNLKTTYETLSFIKNVWQGRNPILFYVGLGIFVISLVIRHIFKKSKKKKIRVAYRILIPVSLLLIILSMCTGLGFGVGIGDGVGVGIDSSNNTNTAQSTNTASISSEEEVTNVSDVFMDENALTIRVRYNNVFVDEKETDLSGLKENIENNLDDGMSLTVIDDYADFSTMRNVESILTNDLSIGKYTVIRSE